jgi:hypothetical protein
LSTKRLTESALPRNSQPLLIRSDPPTFRPSVITSKPAIHDHFKTGQRNLTRDGGFLLPCHRHFGNQHPPNGRVRQLIGLHAIRHVDYRHGASPPQVVLIPLKVVSDFDLIPVTRSEVVAVKWNRVLASMVGPFLLDISPPRFISSSSKRSDAAGAFLAASLLSCWGLFFLLGQNPKFPHQNLAPGSPRSDDLTAPRPEGPPLFAPASYPRTSSVSIRRSTRCGGVVHQPVENAVGPGGITDPLVPLGHPHLLVKIVERSG